MLPLEYPGITCSIARTLEVVGDRWTLLVLRIALVGQSRFEQFSASLGIARNVLSDRLARLVDEGILERARYQERPERFEYHVTDKGRELWRVLIPMVEWGDRYHAPDGPPRIIRHADCGGRVRQQLRCERCRRQVNPGRIMTSPGPGASSLVPPDTT